MRVKLALAGKGGGVHAQPLSLHLPSPVKLQCTLHTVQTVAADLRQGEHIPKMQNDIGHKSKLRMLRQRGGKEAGGSRAVPGHAARRSA